MNIFEYILLFSSVFVGGGVAFYVKKNDKIKLQLVLSFSGAYLLGITVLHLIPEIFSANVNSSNMGFYILGGFFLQLILEQLSGGVEHGHIHTTTHPPSGLILSLMIGLCAHALLEGLPLEVYGIIDHDHSKNHLLYGIILHKIPASFALALMLLLSGIKKFLVLVNLFIFASMSPLGSVFASQLTLNPTQLHALIALVVGSFLHIATTILFEIDNASQHRISFFKMIAIAAGLALALMTM